MIAGSRTRGPRCPVLYERPSERGLRLSTAYSSATPPRSTCDRHYTLAQGRAVARDGARAAVSGMAGSFTLIGSLQLEEIERRLVLVTTSTSPVTCQLRPGTRLASTF